MCPLDHEGLSGRRPDAGFEPAACAWNATSWGLLGVGKQAGSQGPSQGWAGRCSHPLEVGRCKRPAVRTIQGTACRSQGKWQGLIRMVKQGGLGLYLSW